MNDLSVCAPEKNPEKATEKSSVQNKEYFFHSNHDEGVSTVEIILQADGFLGQTWRYLKKVPGNKYTSFYYRCTHGPPYSKWSAIFKFISWNRHIQNRVN